MQPDTAPRNTRRAVALLVHAAAPERRHVLWGTAWLLLAASLEAAGPLLGKYFIDKYLLQNDTAFNWYRPNQNIYAPDTATLNAFKRAKGKFQFVLFGGTWCEDTEFVLPRFRPGFSW